MRDELEKLRRQALAELDGAARSEDLHAVRTKYLGRKGLLTAFLRRLGEIKDEERPALGKLTNDIKQELSARVDEALRRLSAEGRHEALLAEKIDVTLPGRGLKYGRLHP
ncbi:MAG TPA: phenylalanine--tRNA ligase subunit alpha, partial [Syntrophales bacterium]|nr:phenylalanine--tRNA ligase subunit alpha [Syntrophales bacterium]